MSARVAVVILGLILLLGVGGAYLATWTPAVPPDAATHVIARATPAGSDAPVAGECLERMTRPGGWLDLCWQTSRIADADAAKDYFVLRVYGTLSGGGGGVRWSVVRADLEGQPADGVFEAWPDGLFEGPCRSASVTGFGLDGGAAGDETICGRTEGVKSESAYGHRVTWQCVGCLLPDQSDHPVVLYEMAAVPAGGQPAWTISAAFGG